MRFGGLRGTVDSLRFGFFGLSVLGSGGVGWGWGEIQTNTCGSAVSFANQRVGGQTLALEGHICFFGKQTDGAISLVNEVTAAISNAGAKYFSATNDHECPFLTLLARKDPVGIFYVQQMV